MLTDVLTGSRSIDAAVIVIYLAVSFLLGVFATRFFRTSQETGEDSYYLAGRKVPGWLNGISVAVTAMNADVAPFYCGMAVVIGLPMAWFYISRFAFAWLLLAVVFAVRWRQMDIRTTPEFYQLRFGGERARLVRGYTAVFTVVVSMIPWIGAGLLGVHKIMGPVFGIESKVTTLVFILPLLLSYVWISGFAGVLVTDVLQSVVILIASFILLGQVLIEAGGPIALADSIRIAHPEEHVEILGMLPAMGHDVMAPLVVLTWFIVPTIGQGGNLDSMGGGQRIFSCRSPRDAARVPVWATWTLFVMLLLVTLPVLGSLANHPELYHASASERETVYGMLLDEYLPTGLLGLALAALLASVMSTVDSHLNHGAQILVNDVIRQIWPNAKALDPADGRSVWIGRLIMLVMLAAAITVVFQADSLFKIAFTLVGIFGTTASFYWGQWWWWRVNFWSWLVAMVGGPLVYFGLGALLPSWGWWQAQLAASEAMQGTMGMLQAVISIGLTTALWITVTLVTRPQPMSTLRNFYLQAQPMGCWGPVRKSIRETMPGTPLPETGILRRGLLIASLGVVWVIFGILALSQLSVGNLQTAGWLALGFIALSPFFRTAFNRQMKRLGA